MLTVGEGLDELLGVLVVHAAGVGEQVEVPAHALDGAAQLAVLKLEVITPEVEEFFHLLLRQLTLKDICFLLFFTGHVATCDFVSANSDDLLATLVERLSEAESDVLHDVDVGAQRQHGGQQRQRAQQQQHGGGGVCVSGPPAPARYIAPRRELMSVITEEELARSHTFLLCLVYIVSMRLISFSIRLGCQVCNFININFNYIENLNLPFDYIIRLISVLDWILLTSWRAVLAMES